MLTDQIKKGRKLIYFKQLRFSESATTKKEDD